MEEWFTNKTNGERIREGNKWERRGKGNKLQPLQVLKDFGVGYIIRRVNLTNHAHTKEKVM